VGWGGGGGGGRRTGVCVRMQRRLMAQVERYVRKETCYMVIEFTRLAPEAYIYIFLGVCTHIWF